MDNALAEMIRRAKALSDALVRYRVMEGSIADIEQAWADLEAIRPSVLAATMRPRRATETDGDSEPGSEPERS